jgi:DNA polymerase III epsilon subunit-like protein
MFLHIKYIIIKIYLMKDFAEKYYELGLNPTCISYIKTKYNLKENNPEKSPCHAWKRWQVRRPKVEEILDLDWKFSNGIGAVLGYASRCIDIDNCNDYDFIKEFLKCLRLPADYEWVVKSPNGFHIHVISGPIYFASHNELVDGVLPIHPNDKYSLMFSKIELRWANHIVLPPTKINGRSYQFINDSFPKKQPARVDMFTIFRTISVFCGNSYGEHGNFEAQKMIFQLCIPSEGYPYAHALYGSLNDDLIKSVIHSSGHIGFDKLPRNIKAGNLYFGFAGSFYINNWNSGSEFFIDVETTGLIKNEFDYENYPRIIQISYCHRRDGEIKSIYVRPDEFTVPMEIENLTGITNDFLIKNGVNIKNALLSIKWPERCQIISHNIEFDLSVLDSEFMRNSNDPYLNSDYRNGNQTFCTMKKFASVFSLKYPKLEEMYKYFFDDLPPIQLHNSSNDLMILMDCYYLMRLHGYIKDNYETQLIE